MSQTLQETLTKLILETGGGWVDILPFALLWVQCTPYLNKVNAFEIMFGRPAHCPRLQEIAIAKMTDQSILQSLQALQSVLKEPLQGSGLTTLGWRRRWSHTLPSAGTWFRYVAASGGGT